MRNPTCKWLRLLASIAVGLLCLPHVSSAVNSQLAALWQVCKHSSIFRHDSWEPGVVIVCWPLFMAFWCARKLHVLMHP